jgi:hypothetical protein
MRIDETQWRQQLTDPVRGVAAVKQLVIAELHVLVPIGTAPPVWLTRDHPDGQSVVPCFLSESSARRFAANQAQLVRVPGRDLFGSLPSTPAWVDPDGVGLLLTPELMKVALTSMPSPEAVGTDRTLSSWTEVLDLAPRSIVFGPAYWRRFRASYPRHAHSCYAFEMARVSDLVRLDRRLGNLEGFDARPFVLAAGFFIRARATGSNTGPYATCFLCNAER